MSAIQYLTHDGRVVEEADHPDAFCQFNANQQGAQELRRRLQERPAERLVLRTPDPVASSMETLIKGNATGGRRR